MQSAGVHEEEEEEEEGEDSSREEEGPGRESSSRSPGGGPEGRGPHGAVSARGGAWARAGGRGPEADGAPGSAGGLEAPPAVWEPRWMRWLTMMLFPKPPMDAMVVLCSRCTTAVMPPSAIRRRIRAKASSPEPNSGDSPGPMRVKRLLTWLKRHFMNLKHAKTTMKNTLLLRVTYSQCGASVPDTDGFFRAERRQPKPLEVTPLEVKPPEVKPPEVTPLEVKPLEVKALEVKPLEVTPLEVSEPTVLAANTRSFKVLKEE
ncbi:hypothetical protein EYF80_006249 [Liparis tanakae]|uniref:Uncharacterized protein n=1 Tax=Liparis tanakae TaxID=230148 RepID=A0A4Z2J0R7_9TELE|nr:hypothetical protein EYF80_006249 [Liparis tanakae]